MRKCMKDSEYKACIDGLGLLEEEEKEMQYVCFREIVSLGWDRKPKKEQKKGLLVFTNENMIFMQQAGWRSSNYTQALRFPLEQIAGISYGRGLLLKYIDVLVGKSGTSEKHRFIIWQGCEEHSNKTDKPKLITQQIQDHLNKIREERKKLAKEALAKGTLPTMIFCKFCGTRNKADQTHCANCRAPLT